MVVSDHPPLILVIVLGVSQWLFVGLLFSSYSSESQQIQYSSVGFSLPRWFFGHGGCLPKLAVAFP